MNIFKKLKAAIFGSGNRKKINFDAVNDTPVPGLSMNASRRAGRSTFSYGSNGKRYRNKMQQAELDRNRWKTGGTGSWAKTHAGKYTIGSIGTRVENLQRRLARKQKHLDSVMLQTKNKVA